MATSLSYADLHKTLREEIMKRQQEIYRIEVWVLVAAAAVYTWQFTHQSFPPAIVAYFVPILVGLCMVRCVDHTLHIRLIGEYLDRIEKAELQNSTLPGWETYYKQSKTYVWVKCTMGVVVCLWIASIGIAIYAPRIFPQPQH